MSRRKCPALRKILAELAADIAQRTYDRTRSYRALVRLQDARLKALLQR
jgi:hypothetical protein